MQTIRIVQAVALMLVVALAASCATSKQYTSKLFTPRNPMDQPKDRQAIALRFLELDNAEPNKEDWVSTNFIMGRDTSSNTFALDNFSKVFPAAPVNAVKKDTLNSRKEKDMEKDAKAVPTILAEAKVEKKPVEEPFAKSYNTGEVRSKRSREEK